ncbi:TPA: phage tail tape measure protein [Staphylococcus delphini]|nr:phage tail tape measure protein [Staphylococcus delphini]
MANPIGNMVIRVDLDGSGFNKGIAGLNRQMRMVSREMSANLSQFGRYDKSLEKSRLKVDGLTKRQQLQSQKVKELKAQYDRLSAETGKNSAKTQAAASKYNEAYAKLNLYEKELVEATNEMKRMETQQRALNTSMGKIGSNLSKWGPKFQEIGRSMQNIGRNMSLYVTAPIVAGFGAAAKKSIDFDDSMRKVKATSGATSKEFGLLRDKALEMGAKTKFSASESADALNYMALAGWDTKEMMSGINGVMQLAAASGEDLGAVSDIVTDSLTAFGLKAKDSGRFADVLAQTSSKANTDVRGLGEAFKYAAPVAGALGYSVEDVSVAIGLMSNAGVKGEKAGTALRTMFTNLAKPTKAMKNEMDRLGIAITDSRGNMLPMRDVMDQLRGKFKGLSKDQQASAAATIFGKEAMSGALAVINASDSDYQKLTKSIDNSTGASKRMSDEMEGGIGGSIRKMKSAFESLAISIGDVLAPHLRRLADFLAALATKFNNMPGWSKTAVVGIGLFAAALGPVILATGLFTSAIGSIAGVVGPAMLAVSKAGGVMALLGQKAPLAAKGLTLVGSAFKFMLGPVGLAIGAIFAIGTAFVIAYKKSETFRNIVNKVINPVVSGFKSLWNVAKNVFDSLKNLFSGNSLPTIDLLSQIMPKATAVKVTATLMQVRQTFINAFGAVWEFAQEIGRKLGKFWKENGDDIIQAFKNIGNFFKGFFVELKNLIGPNLQELGNLIKTIFMNIIVPTIKIAMGIIWSVMKLVWPLIKILIVDTWNNIKGIITGALDVILGIVKVFAGVFTGQWGKAWDGVKQIFSGALTLIWNLIQLWLIGKVLKVVKIFGGLFKGAFSSLFRGASSIVSGSLKFMWSIISAIFKRINSFTRSIFTALRGFFSAIFSAIRNTVVRLVRSMWNSIRGVFSNLSSWTRKIFSNLRSFLVNLWNSIRTRVTSTVRDLWHKVKSTFTNLFNGTRNIFNRVKSTITNIWTSIKRSVTGIASSLWNSVRRTFTNMKNGLKSIIDKIKDHIGGMVNAVKRGLNKLIDGVNWVAGKIGMDKLPKFKLHTGTTHTTTHNLVTNGKINRDTFATVGDKGRGNGPGGFRHEMIRYPNGKMALTPNRDTTAFLPKGSAVYNGAQTHAMLNGAMPKFSNGTVFDLLSDKKKPKSHKHGDDVGGDVVVKKGGGGSKESLIGQALNAGKAYVSKALGMAAKGKDWLSKTVGDVLDWIDKPGKLLDKVIDAFGVNFEALKGAEIPYNMMKALFKKLKNATIDLFTGWLEDSGGGEGGWVDISKGINFPFSPHGRAPGYPFPYPHMGVDLNYVYDKLYSTHGGVATGKTGYNGGFGNSMWIKSGIYEIIYGHMSKLAWTGSKKVHPGSYLGISGNTGMSSGPHLHYEMRKNGVPIDPMPFLKSQTKGGKGGSGAAYASRIIKQAQSILGGRYKGSYVHEQMMRVAKRESNYQPNVVNNWDINALRGDPSRGLFQIIGSTFRANAKSGYTNFSNPLHQAISAMRYIVARYGWGGFKRAGDYAYATGGLVHKGLYQIGEEGYPEWIIPTDPSRASDAAKLLALASKDISKNKRPKNFNTSAIGNDTNGNSKIESKLDTMIGLLIKLVGSNEEIADKDYNPIIDNFGLKDFINATMDKRERDKSRKGRYGGGALI